VSSTLQSHSPTHSITIQRIGAEGDGIANDAHGTTYYVPFTLPHEVVSYEIVKESRGTVHARAQTIHVPSPERIQPRCAVFEHCGGCQLQHASSTLYHEFKTGKLVSVLHRLGVNNVQTLSTLHTGWGSRRRVDLAVSSRRGETVLGFHGTFHTQVIDIAGACPIAEPAIEHVLPALKHQCEQLQRVKHLHGIHVQVVDADKLDITLRTRQLSSKHDQALWVEFGAAHPQIARISEIEDSDETFTRTWFGEPVFLSIGGCAVELPAGAFLQAASAGQSALTDFVLQHTAHAQRIIDCYCGLGTYTLPLLQRGAQLYALEGSEAMIHALYNAAMRAGMDTRITAQARDLFKHPLAASDIARYDAIVINPPRNGALPQTQAIAKSAIAQVVMISCNPITFERDARILLDAGYIMTSVQAIDQFHMSSHLEIAAAFTKS
jgi:23S rRNA (uracil1939-C5)-methyltransferase